MASYAKFELIQAYNGVTAADESTVDKKKRDRERTESSRSVVWKGNGTYTRHNGIASDVVDLGESAGVKGILNAKDGHTFGFSARTNRISQSDLDVMLHAVCTVTLS